MRVLPSLRHRISRHAGQRVPLRDAARACQLPSSEVRGTPLSSCPQSVNYRVQNTTPPAVPPKVTMLIELVPLDLEGALPSFTPGGGY